MQSGITRENRRQICALRREPWVITEENWWRLNPNDLTSTREQTQNFSHIAATPAKLPTLDLLGSPWRYGWRHDVALQQFQITNWWAKLVG
jgi:hypothetical protein